MDTKNTVTVLIMGREYTLSGDMPREYIMKLADIVDAKMKLVSDGNQSNFQSAVIAAMLIADDLCKTKEDETALYNETIELGEKAKNFEDLLEQTKKELEACRETSSGFIHAESGTAEIYKARMGELEQKYDDMQHNFFDLQMENIRLKNEIDRLKK